MNRYILILVLTICCNSILAQSSSNALSFEQKDSTKWKLWLEDLLEHGVKITDDSLKLSADAIRIIQDSNYRNSIYPERYTWENVRDLLQNMELKQGVWHILNLYIEDTLHRNLAIKALIPFDNVVPMDEVLKSSFYTYGILDPRVCKIENGKPVILRPDIVQMELEKVKELVAYVEYYRALDDDDLGEKE